MSATSTMIKWEEMCSNGMNMFKYESLRVECTRSKERPRKFVFGVTKSYLKIKNSKYYMKFNEGERLRLMSSCCITFKECLLN